MLIEGPADADPLLGWVTADGMVPPLALLAYAPTSRRSPPSGRSRTFSPEWQAHGLGRRHGIEVGSATCRLRMTLAPLRSHAVHEPIGRQPGDPSHDPLGTLAAAAGYDDAERWWEDLVESRLDGSSPFPLLTEAMAELRLASQPGRANEQRREAYMRKTIRAALRRGRSRVAVVCGAWHAPALRWPLPPASHDAATLRGARRRKVTLTWVPWTHQRLASAERLRRRGDLARLVPPPLDRAGPHDRALADPGRAQPARA